MHRPSLATALGLVYAATSAVAAGLSCDASAAQRLFVQDDPYANWFYSDCHGSTHVVTRQPAASGGLENRHARLIFAWPAGNSGAALYFAATDGSNVAALRIQILGGQQALQPVYNAVDGYRPFVGVSGQLQFNASAKLNVAVLGSIRTIRDVDSGFGNFDPIIRAPTHAWLLNGGGAVVTRLWLDNRTTTTIKFAPVQGASAITLDPNGHLLFGRGTYQVNSSFNYPQLQQLATTQVLDSTHQGLIAQNPDATTSLSFMSYTDKLLAGSWHYLTYFGRDTMLTLLLMQSVLNLGENSAVEAAIGSVLERVSRDDGSTCHEETIGDYAALLNYKAGRSSSAPGCDYKMIDTDYYLPIALKNYLLDTTVGRQRTSAFMAKQASFLENNVGLTYRQLAELTIGKVMSQAAPFAASGGQTKANLVRLKDNEQVGQWRDSGSGIGYGRIPFDVNTALVPAALRAIAAMASAGLFPEHPEWAQQAAAYAPVWEDKTLQFFQVDIAKSKAVSLVNSYVSTSQFSGPSHTDTITSDVHFYALSLDGPNSQSQVQTMHTDDCFRHFLLNTTNQAQLTALVSQTADNILRPFPAGLATDIGLLIANPAYGQDPYYAQTWTRGAYHGTVVWSWQMAMMAAGLQKQLQRCTSSAIPDFCKDSTVLSKVKQAYNRLWDIIEANTDQLGQEAWSWTYNNGFKITSFGELGSGEGDVRQLWSLTFLAVTRQKF